MPPPRPPADSRIRSLPADEIRGRFVKFFAERGHAVVPSASLVPAGDQTLLFTNSGMVQFKEVFTGAETRSYNRAVDYQRCLRVAGKHNDFEEVGRTPRHHTLFEMLGNWSFGDYFKPDAIRWAWQLLTEGYGIPGDRLAATVYTDDDEAYGLWRDEIGLPESRIARWGNVEEGDDHNFWRMADTGPCGPCSEIHFDRGEEFSEGDFCVPDHSEHCPRWLEIWNLVFMEFDQRPDGRRVPLPFRSVDTGMGLERLASVIQQVPTNYDTDLFKPIHEALMRMLGHDPERFESERFSYQVIADHVRAVTFLAADEVRPSNEGRGYVMRRIVRRAVRHGRLLGRSEPFLAQLSYEVIKKMASAYPILQQRQSEIQDVIAHEERQFARTLDAGMVHLEDALIPLTSAEREIGRREEDLPRDALTLPGRVAFQLHDTYGFPIDLTVELAAEYGVRVERSGFDGALAEQRERSRSGRKAELARHAERTSLYESAIRRAGESVFLGYETTVADGRVVAIFRDGIDYAELTGNGEAEVVLDQTPFYAEGGGQIGDRGRLREPGGGSDLFTVADTQRPAGGLIVHRGRLHGRLAVGDIVMAEVDADRRARTMRNHTGTHLLHRALRNVVGESARQAGSRVAPEDLRFDFPLDRPLTDGEKRAIEAEVRRMVREDRPVTVAYLPMAQAIEAGADAFFDEKYGETVRTVRVEGYSHELCGGTHCRSSGQIGNFIITGERSIGSGVRRVEAVTGEAADALVTARFDALDRIGELVGAQTIDAIADRVAALQEELREAKRRLRSGAGTTKGRVQDIAEAAAEVTSGVRLAFWQAQWESVDAMKAFGKELRAAFPSGVIVLADPSAEPQLFVSVSDDLVGRGVRAGDLVREAAAAIGGRGGGSPTMGQAKGTRPEGVGDAIETIRRTLEASG
ncbi:MAG TPA: alanine--tRNA ligase [Candidatus Saccharimonadales bacterium]|nr:alanine--tRNA ligase [Candidatus Saccharimonadales bacterium]